MCQAFCEQNVTTESTKHQKVEATSFDETCEIKKANNFEKLHEMKKEKKERTSETANCISLQKRRYIFCRKTLFTTKHKTLKRQKKAKMQHLKTMDCGLFFS